MANVVAVKAVKAVSAIIIVVIVAAALYYLYTYAMDSPYRIDSQEARQLINNKQVDLIIDVRTDLELQTLGFYPGSVHIQSQDLEKEMPQRYPDKNIRIIAYCNSGQRARIATEKLHKLGYTNARYIPTTYLSLY
jgi:rhodanese-related sulfurtransferase